ncbi:hypothetical protein SAMN04487916_102310 [Arthrobacter sp. ov407]|uniref:hypothetical protein n=1 Tax=Arthrobacter sp. ov407 TaxID=1761748 RepID=UPI00088AA37F|nr:hypothetical protein [Arthrobacter sp. ov407]SDK73012.1 hypothetical protein SAMN04487916_102310 [Arthrobacter sp. ov407]
MVAWDSRDGRGRLAPRGPANPAAAFRHLCRSSPWKWQSLRFEYLDRPLTSSTGSATAAAPDGLIKAWLRRPGALRLETADGLVIASTTGINDSRGGFYVSSTRKTWLLPPHLVTPVYDDDGLVRRRPEAAYGEPSFGNGRFAAALDPVELAGNSPVPLEFPNANAVELGPITEVDHEGRPTLETTLSPNPSYRPADPGAPLCRPGRTLLRIDAGTGVCVASRWLDAPGAGNEQNGYGHWLRILGVDEYMLDDLFLAESMNLTDVRRHISWDVPAE